MGIFYYVCICMVNVKNGVFLFIFHRNFLNLKHISIIREFISWVVDISFERIFPICFSSSLSSISLCVFLFTRIWLGYWFLRKHTDILLHLCCIIRNIFDRNFAFSEKIFYHFFSCLFSTNCKIARNSSDMITFCVSYLSCVWRMTDGILVFVFPRWMPCYRFR